MASGTAFSLFQSVPNIPPDPAFNLIDTYKKDVFEHKVDLCPGFYRDEHAKPWILPSVEKAEALIYADQTLDHEHLPLQGHPVLITKSQDLIFGTELKGSDLSSSNTTSRSRIASIQTLSGTGANYLGAVLCSDFLKPRHVWISNPSWINHTEIWERASIGTAIEQRFYPYYNKDSQSLDFDGMKNTLENDTHPGDVVILHACAHNPTGIDLSESQWKIVADICVEKRLFPLFDVAYQGFATGNLHQDAWPIRHFYHHTPLEFAVAQSYSKNFGLYGERTGALHVVTSSQDEATRVLGVLKQTQRAQITSPPSYGARIVSTILATEELYQQWIADLHHMSGRMQSMRHRLYEELLKRNVPGKWEHILTEIGMFSLTGLSREQVALLREKYHIYMLPSGRISVTGLTEYNVEYVAEAFSQTLGGQTAQD